MGKKKRNKTSASENPGTSSKQLSESEMMLASPATMSMSDGMADRSPQSDQSAMDALNQDMSLNIFSADAQNADTERQLRSMAKLQANSVQMQTKLAAGVLRQISSTGRMASLDEPLRLYEESMQRICFELKEDSLEPMQRGRILPKLELGVRILQQYQGFVDKLFAHLNVAESISKFHQLITSAETERNIRLAFEGLKVYSEEAFEVYRSILSESSTIHMKLRQLTSASRKMAENSARRCNGATNTALGEREELQAASDMLQESFYKIELNIYKYRCLIEEDLTTLVCIERDIEVCTRGWKVVFWFAFVCTLVSLMLACYNIDGRFTIFPTNLYVFLSILVTLGLFAYCNHWMFRKERGLENLMIKAKAKLNQAEKFLQAKMASLARPAQPQPTSSIQLQTAMLMPQVTFSQEYQQLPSPKGVVSRRR